MQPWLASALHYIPTWLAYQQASSEQPGVAVAIASGEKMVLEAAFGSASLATREALTPRHRFRVASHSKTFTAAGIMKLREAGRLSLDDSAGKFVPGLHADVARATLAQLLSHSSGLMRDGLDAGQFHDRKPFLSRAEIMADLARPQPLEPAVAFKYSNHAFALAGFIIEQVTGEPYAAWIRREVIDAAGLEETEPEFAAARVQPFARGHTMKLPFGRRLVVPGEGLGRAIASAGGFVSTAADLARFYARLSPASDARLLSKASRREMTRRHWRDAHSVIERYYGLGTISGPPGPWAWVGHSGSWQGYITRTATIPDQRLTISVLTNAVDGPAHLWVDGIMQILRTLEARGAPTSSTADWTGRWWGLWGPLDLVPVADGVLVANPALTSPFTDASELSISGADTGKVEKAQAFGDLGEDLRRARDATGAVKSLWIGGKEFKREAEFRAEFEGKYGAGG